MTPPTGFAGLFRMLGLAITLPTVLVSGPLAGFLLAEWMIRKWNSPRESTMILVLLGSLVSAIQSVRILRRLYQGSKES